MNKELLKDKNFVEAQKQFMRLCEWSYVPKTLEEEGEDEEQPQNDDFGGDMNQNEPNMQDNMDMPQDDMQDMDDGGMPQDDIQGIDNGNMPQGDTQDMGNDNIGDPMIGGDNAMLDMGGGMEDEEVIDVDDLTNAQEKMNDKVNVVGQDLGDVNSKIESLLGILGNMEQMINNNNQEIEKFKAEFEKRNPTQTEKLNLRSLDSYPFNVNPKDYWAEKGSDPNSNYSGISDNDKSTTQEYQITNNDVDDFNEREIEKSFDIDDDLQQDLKKIFGF